MDSKHTSTSDSDDRSCPMPALNRPHSDQPTEPPYSELILLDAIDWSFEDADTKEHIHGLHTYPARMPPQIPRTLFQYFEHTGDLSAGDCVYDPFSGSGTTAVEARCAGLDSISNDVNPFACKLTQAKAIPLDTDTVSAFCDDLLDGLESELHTVRERSRAGTELPMAEPEIREGWFPHPQLYELCAIRDRIDRLEAEAPADVASTDIARVFRVALAYTTRRVSYQRNGEYKRWRLAEADRETHNPDVHEIFTRKLAENIELMQSYRAIAPRACDTTVYHADSRQADHLDANSVDMVMTSPPYGDHSTTVAYGQFSQDPAIVAWGRGYDEMRQVDKNGLGGANDYVEPLATLEEQSAALAETLRILREKDGRADDALTFFSDYAAVMDDVARVTKPGQPVVWVVANRTMSRVNIPTHLITLELCAHRGYAHETTLPREIPTKTLPWENAPENLPGVTGELMANEHILLMRAPETDAE